MASTVADEFAARFDAALRIDRTDVKHAQPPYDRLNEYVRQLRTVDEVDACLTRYLAIHSRYPKDDPRSEMVFVMLAERRIANCPADDDFVDRLADDVAGRHKPPSAVAARIGELAPDRRNSVLRVLKETRARRQTGGSVLDPLTQMYRKDHQGRSARSVEDLYGYDPTDDPAARKRYDATVGPVYAAWNQAAREFASRNRAYDLATTATEVLRQATTGYRGFTLRFAAFIDFLHDQRADARQLFGMLKWARDEIRPAQQVTPHGTRVTGIGATYLDYEIYAHLVFAVYLHAIQQRDLARSPEGFTAAEDAFLLGPLRRGDYASNFTNRFRLVLPGGGRPSNVAAFGRLSTLYCELILFGRSQNLELVPDAPALEMQRQLAAMPWYDLAAQRFSTAGQSTWSYAQGQYARGDEIGPGVRVVDFAGTGRATRVYLELSATPGFLYKATLPSFINKVEVGLYAWLWEDNKGIIPLIQQLFDVIGYLPVLVEAGFAGLIKQIVQDHMIAAGVAEASDALGVDLDGLALVLPLVLPLVGRYAAERVRGSSAAHQASAADRVLPSSAERTPSAATLDRALNASTERSIPVSAGRTVAEAAERIPGATRAERFGSRPEPPPGRSSGRPPEAEPASPIGGGAADPPGAADRTLATAVGERNRLTGGRPEPRDRMVARATAGEDRLAGSAPGRDTRMAGRPDPVDPRAARAADAALAEHDARAAKAIDQHLRRVDPRMTAARERAVDTDTRSTERAVADTASAQVAAQAEGTTRAQLVGGAQAEVVPAARARGGGALNTEAAAGSGSGGRRPSGGSGASGDRPRRIYVPGPEVGAQRAARAGSPPAPAEPEPATPRGAGQAFQDVELRRYVLEQVSERINDARTDPTAYFGVHDSVRVDGVRVGGRNSFGHIAEGLAEVSDLRVRRGLPALPLAGNLEELEINLIRRHGDLRAEYERLTLLASGRRVPEFERLSLSPKRIGQIRDELDRMVMRQVKVLKPDVFQAWFDRRRHAQIADLTLALGDPYHTFKSRVYKRITTELLPGFQVIGFDIKQVGGKYYLGPIP